MFSEKSGYSPGKKRVTFVTFEADQTGAGKAIWRAFEAAQMNSPQLDFSMRTIKKSLHGGPNSALISGYRGSWIRRVVLVEPRILMRKAIKFAYRLLRGRTTVSSAGVFTGLGAELSNCDSDLLVVNWLGDYTISVEELASVNKPIVIRNPDLWWMLDGEHYPFHSNYEKELAGALRLGFSQQRREIFRHVARRASGVVFPSHWAQHEAEKRGTFPEAISAVIPNALDPQKWSPSSPGSARLLFGMPSEKFILGFGAIQGLRDYRKGSRIVLQVLELLRKTKPKSFQKIEMWVFGSSTRLPAEWRGLARSVGPLDDKGLVHFYSAVDAMVVPSRYETFGQVTAESMMCGTPVIASAQGGALDIVNHLETGLLFSPDDPRSLLESILFALKNDDWRRCAGVSARESLQNICAPDIVGASWNKFLLSVLEV